VEERETGGNRGVPLMSPDSMSAAFAEKVFVYIVESPSPVDLYDGRGESRTLASALDLMGLQSVTRLVVDKRRFIEALTAGVRNACADLRRTKLILHISAHGCDERDGLVLTSGELVTWDELRMHLLPLNKLTGGLVVSMSSCYGFSACQTAMQDGELPYWLLNGPISNVSWRESALWFVTYYYNLMMKLDPIAAGRAANAAIGDENKFRFNEAKIAQSIATGTAPNQPTIDKQ
jgi:hypothetical protein